MLNTGTVLGTALDALDTEIGNLEGRAADGGFFLDDVGGLTIGGIGSTNGVAATGGLGDS